MTELDDAGVATGTVADLRDDLVEEFAHGVLVLQITEDHAAVGGGIVLGLGDKRLDVLAKGLCLGNGRSDSLVLEQRAGHVGHHGLPVGSRTTQVVEFLVMSHWIS